MRRLDAAEQWARVNSILQPLEWHDMDQARLLLECGCEPGWATELSMTQADQLGAWLEVDPEYLLGREPDPVVHPNLYHNVPSELWRAIITAAISRTLREVLILKVEGMNLNRLRPGMGTDDPRSMLAVVLTLQRPLGSYVVETWQLWQPEPWVYPKSREHVLSALLLLQALDARGFTGCYPRGLEIPADEMKALNEGEVHITAVLGHHRWLPKWDVQNFLQPSGLLASRRRSEIEQSLQHYGDWRAMLPDRR